MRMIKILSRLTGMDRSYGWNNFISPSRDPGKINGDLGKAGWLTSHVNRTQFYKVFIRIAEISAKRASSPPYEQPLKKDYTISDLILKPVVCKAYSPLGVYVRLSASTSHDTQSVALSVVLLLIKT